MKEEFLKSISQCIIADTK